MSTTNPTNPVPPRDEVIRSAAEYRATLTAFRRGVVSKAELKAAAAAHIAAVRALYGTAQP